MRHVQALEGHLPPMPPPPPGCRMLAVHRTAHNTLCALHSSTATQNTSANVWEDNKQLLERYCRLTVMFNKSFQCCMPQMPHRPSTTLVWWLAAAAHSAAPAAATVASPYSAAAGKCASQ